MAKKQETKKEVEVPVVETTIVESPKPKKVEPKKPSWEIKDRMYYLKNKDRGPKPSTLKNMLVH